MWERLLHIPITILWSKSYRIMRILSDQAKFLFMLLINLDHLEPKTSRIDLLRRLIRCQVIFLLTSQKGSVKKLILSKDWVDSHSHLKDFTCMKHFNLKVPIKMEDEMIDTHLQTILRTKSFTRTQNQHLSQHIKKACQEP